ncbi:MAG: hypothetical protein Q4B70_03350 [Lachnospiraceae bacterium]|nr:hypothetical protein [Lachnospiraceae bacterium]
MRNQSDYDLKNMLDDVAEAICVVDRNYHILYANRMAFSFGENVFDRKSDGDKCYQKLLAGSLLAHFTGKTTVRSFL